MYGLDLPKIKKVLPTNIPTVKANEQYGRLKKRVDSSTLLNDEAAKTFEEEERQAVAETEERISKKCA